MINFYPEGAGLVGSGTSDEKGNYEIAAPKRQTLPAGQYVVTVVKMAPPDEIRGDPPLLLTPLKYARKDKSGLKVTVNEGRTVIPLELTSR